MDFKEIRLKVDEFEDEWLAEEWYDILTRTEEYVKFESDNEINEELQKTLLHYCSKEKLSDLLINNIKILSIQDRLTLPFEMLRTIVDYIDKGKFLNAIDLWISPVTPIVYTKDINISGMGLINECEDAKLIRESIVLSTDYSETDRRVELLTCFAPLGFDKKTISLDNKKYTVDKNMQLIMDFLPYLDESGEVIILLTDSNLMECRENGFFEAIGLYPKAIFGLGVGAFNPITSINTNIVVLSREVMEQVFISEFSRNYDHNKIILKNFLKQKTSSNKRNGLIIERRKINSMTKVLEALEIKLEFKKIPYEYVKLQDISISISKFSDLTEIDSDMSYVFIPSIGNKDVICSTSEMGMKIDRYYSVLVNDAIVNNEFLARFLNTNLGKKIRNNIANHSSLAYINLIEIKNCTFKLPPMNIQDGIIEASKQLENSKGQIDILSNELWKSIGATKLKEVKKKIKKWEIDSNIETWIDTLPFPLASILWNYHRTSDELSKVNNLLFFFENLSEFLCIVLLSSFYSDKIFYKKNKKRWLNTNPSNKEWYKKATFGQWNHLYSNLSKIAREKFNTKEHDYMMKILGNPSEEYLNIVHKDVSNILRNTAHLRNKWKGHGGVAGSEEINRRLEVLEAYLGNIRVVLNNSFSDTRLVYPIDGKKFKGEYTNRVLYLSGTRSPFLEKTIKANDILDGDELYIYHTNGYNPVQLLPLIKFEADINAFYFYTSIESSKIRWVSYHYEKESEIETDYIDKFLEAFEEETKL